MRVHWFARTFMAMGATHLSQANGKQIPDAAPHEEVWHQLGFNKA